MVATSVVPTIAVQYTCAGWISKGNKWEEVCCEPENKRSRGPEDQRIQGPNKLREGIYKTPKLFIQLSRKPRFFPGNQHHGLKFTQTLIFDHFHFWDDYCWNSHHPETHLQGDHRRLACAGSKFNRKSSFASPPPVRVFRPICCSRWVCCTSSFHEIRIKCIYMCMSAYR